MSTAPRVPGIDAEDMTDREEIIQSLRSARLELLDKIENGRVRDEEKERVRVKQWRALAYISKVELNALEDRDLEAFHDRLDALEEGVK